MYVCVCIFSVYRSLEGEETIMLEVEDAYERKRRRRTWHEDCLDDDTVSLSGLSGMDSEETDENTAPPAQVVITT